MNQPTLPQVPVPHVNPGIMTSQSLVSPNVPPAAVESVQEVTTHIPNPIQFTPEVEQGQPSANYEVQRPDISQSYREPVQSVSAEYQESAAIIQAAAVVMPPTVAPVMTEAESNAEWDAVLSPTPQTLSQQIGDKVKEAKNAFHQSIIPQQTQEINIPFGEGEMFVSNSRLEGVSRCALQTALKLLKWKSKKAQPVMESGTALHEGLYEFFRTKEIDRVRAVVEDYYRPIVEAAEEVWPQYELHNILAIVTEYCNRNINRVYPWTYDPGGIEMGFEAPLYGKVKVRGLIDMLVRETASGQIAFVDIKTTGTLDAKKEKIWSMSTQFAQYTHALKEIYNEDVFGGFVEGIHVKKLPNSKKTCKEHKVFFSQCGEQHAFFKTLPVPQNHQKLANWKNTAIALAKKLWAMKKFVKDESCLDTIPNQGMFNMSCNYCEYSDYCELGRQETVLKSMYEKVDYDPFEGRPMIKAVEGGVA